MKHHLNTSKYQKVDSNSDKYVFNDLKFLIKNYESCLIMDEMKYILNSNYKSSHFYVLPKCISLRTLKKKLMKVAIFV